MNYFSEERVERRSEQQISNEARRIRESVNNISDCFDITRFIEYDLPKMVNNFRLRIVSDEDDDVNIIGVEALTIINEDGITMYLPEKTYDGARLGSGPKRFTLAHEVAHVLLHSKDNVIFARFSNSDYERRPFDKMCNAEVQANIFAAELLVPSQYISGLSVNQIMNTYNVSRTVAQIQHRKSQR